VSAANVTSVSCWLLRESVRPNWLVPVKFPVPFDGRDAGVAAGRLRDQARNVHRVKRDIRADRGVHGGSKLALVFDAGLRNARGEIDERLLLGEGSQAVGGRFESGQLLIGVKDVELGFVGHERTGVVAFGRRPRIAEAVHFARCADLELADIADQKFPIIGEVFDCFDRRAVGHDGDQIGRGHLLLQEQNGAILRAQSDPREPWTKSRRRG
jgi:hypothetical protein